MQILDKTLKNMFTRVVICLEEIIEQMPRILVDN